MVISNTVRLGLWRLRHNTGYERGEAESNFDVLLRICELLNTTPNDLITYRTLQTGHNPHSETA